MSAPTGHSIVSCLYGPWGSGKASLLNIVGEELQRAKGHSVIACFNPWLYTPSDNLFLRRFLPLYLKRFSAGHGH